MSIEKTLILGIGNTLLSDEGVGVHMLDYLRRHCPELSNATFLDGGTLSFTLASWLEGADYLVVIDAAGLAASPGTVQVFEDSAMDRFAGRTRRSVHEVSLADLLAIAHLTQALPAHRALVAIQPQQIDWGHTLSNTVKLALPRAAREVLALLRQWTVLRSDPSPGYTLAPTVSAS